MDVPETEHILETAATTASHPSSIPPIEPEQLKAEYDNILRLARKLANAIDILSTTQDSDESNSGLRNFCLETGIPTAFTKERLLFKKSLLNKIEDQMFLPSSSNIKPGGPGANILDVRNVGNITEIEKVIEYGPIWKYLEEEDDNDGKSYLEARFVEEFKKLTSPLQVMKSKFFKVNTPIDLFISLVKAQYRIKWCTEDGQYNPGLNFFETVDEKFQKHRLYNAWLQTKLYEHRTKIEALNGDFSKFKDAIPKFIRKKTFQGKKARSKRKMNATYVPNSYAWRSFAGSDEVEGFPIDWLPPKLKTVVKKHTADHVKKGPADSRSDDDEDEGHGSIDGENEANKNPNIIVEDTDATGPNSANNKNGDLPGNNESLTSEEEANATSAGVYMLIIKNENAPNGCQIFFNYFINNLDSSIKKHERAVSRIAVNLCKMDNFHYDASLKTVDILLLMNILLSKEIVCFEIARNLEEVGDAVAILLEITSKETMLDVQPEEVMLWGVSTSPCYGLNSKIDLTDLRNRFTPSEFPGSER